MTVIRCSSLDRILGCPGSMTLTPLVKARTGAEGDEGTALHQLSHARMVAELGASGDPGKPVECKAIGFSKWISDYYFRTVQDNVPPDWSLEVEVGIAYNFARFTLSGHIDSLAMNADCTEAILFDLKSGYIAVDVAEYNWQILAYIALLLLAYPTLRKVTAYIVQPRADEDEGEQRVSKVVIENVAQAVAGLETFINAALDKPMELESGMTQCRWCPAAMECPAIIEERDHMKHTLTKQEVAQMRAQPDDALLAQWVISSRTLRQPIEDALELAKERIETMGSITTSDGNTITTKETMGSYEIPDRPAFLRQFREVLPADASLAKCYKPSMTAIKDEIAEVMQVKKTSKTDPANAESIFDAQFRPLVIQNKKKLFVFSK